MKQSRFRPIEHRLNLGFVDDKHTVGRKMARNSRKIAILLLLFILIQTISYTHLRSNCFHLVFRRVEETINCFQDLLTFLELAFLTTNMRTS